MGNKRQMRRHKDRVNQAPEEAEMSEVLARMQHHPNRAKLAKRWDDVKAGRGTMTRLEVQHMEHGRAGESLEDFKRRCGL
jgi:hypothetical protein